MNTGKLEPIKKEKVSDMIYRQLLDMIKSGEWKPGFKLPSENKLCGMFNVSRISVRTALQKLEAVGLIEVKNGEGAFVKSTDIETVLVKMAETVTLSPEDVIDILLFRKVIEKACIEEMALKPASEKVAELENCLMEMKHFGESGDIAEYSAWDAKFHRIIIECSGNRVMVSVYNLLFDSLYEHLYTMNKSLGVELGLPYHEEMLEAIKAGDPIKAGDCVERSIESSVKNMRSMK
ncbi:MAG: FadR/GntR family transcriptional regulator [Eubacteriales bacterium]|nr:FadR/GntR family transcriptional regulator [Eubacteriales bacterium]